jgi:hypothetical protein
VKTPVARGVGARVCALFEAADMRLPTLLLGSTRWHFLGGRRCEPKNSAGPQIAIGASYRDALNLLFFNEKECILSIYKKTSQLCQNLDVSRV